MTSILTAQDKVFQLFSSFVRNLELYQGRVQVGDVLIFTLLYEQSVNTESNRITFQISLIQHLSAAINSLKQYFPDMDTYQFNSWILGSFSTYDDIITDEDVAAKVEFLGLRENSLLEFQNYDLCKFWREACAEYPVKVNRALKILIPFVIRRIRHH